jgi:hypothetical protein
MGRRASLSGKSLTLSWFLYYAFKELGENGKARVVHPPFLRRTKGGKAARKRAVLAAEPDILRPAPPESEE